MRRLSGSVRSVKVVPKDPVSTEHLTRLCDMFTHSTDLAIVRDMCMILLAYSGFFRYDELSAIRCNDITVFPEYLRVDVSMEVVLILPP